MRKFIYFFVLILFITSLFNCKSAKKKFEEGDYIGAYEDAYKALKKGKNEKDNKVLLRKALVKLNNDFKTKSTNFSSQNLKGKIETTEQAIALLDRADRAMNYIDLSSLINIDSLRRSENEYKNTTGNLLKQDAITLIEQLKNKKNKSLAPQALQTLDLVERYTGLSPETKGLKDEVFKYGTVIYNFIVEQWGYDFNSYDLNRVFNNLENESNNRLLKIVYNRNLQEIDCHYIVKLSRPNTDENNQTSSQNYTKSVEDGFEIQKDSKGNEVKVKKYKNVVGTVTTNRRTRRLSVDVSVDLRGTDNVCRGYDGRFTKYSESISEEYKLSGDQRAIPSQYQRPRNDNKSRNQMEEELLTAIYNELRARYLE